MVDCESEVLTRVKNALYADYPLVKVESEYPRNIKEFPHVYLTMSDNPIDTLRGEQEYALPTFTIEVYTNGDGKRALGRKIAAVIDAEMSSMNFERMSMTEVPNLEDATISRYVLRYQGETDGKFFYRR